MSGVSDVSVAFAAPTAVPPLLIATVESAGDQASKNNQPGLMQCTADFCNKIGPKADMDRRVRYARS